METDINDIFEDILFSEDTQFKEGYDEGYQVGISQENIEGYHLGYHRGAEIGAELGYYRGFIESHEELCENENKTIPEKAKKIKEQLLTLIDEFPRTNDESTDFTETMDNIRAKFKMFSALLKLDGNYPERNNKSF